jgi:hypothetical protein
MRYEYGRAGEYAGGDTQSSHVLPLGAGHVVGGGVGVGVGVGGVGMVGVGVGVGVEVGERDVDGGEELAIFAQEHGDSYEYSPGSHKQHGEVGPAEADVEMSLHAMAAYRGANGEMLEAYHGHMEPGGHHPFVVERDLVKSAMGGAVYTGEMHSSLPAPSLHSLSLDAFHGNALSPDDFLSEDHPLFHSSLGSLS